MTHKIAFQGRPGAYSHMACLAAFPALEPLPCPTFYDAFKAVDGGRADYAMIPIDNSIAGRVADIHQLEARPVSPIDRGQDLIGNNGLPCAARVVPIE